MSAHGFDSLETPGLIRVIALYRAGIADIEAGRSNWAGGTLRQLRRWLREAQSDLANRKDAA